MVTWEGFSIFYNRMHKWIYFVIIQMISDIVERGH